MGRVSMPQGKGSQLHNRREYEKIGKPIPDNIDPSKTRDNITLVDKDLRQAYQEIFGEALDQYNGKQKRADRRIEDYYDHIKQSKNGEKLFYEDVVQWGKMDDFTDEETRQKAKKALVEYGSTFEARNPNLRLVGAYIHMDEASPHLHIDYVPVAHGYSRGMMARNSLDRAMKEMGFMPEKESRKNNATKLWKEHERDVFGEICRGMGLTVEEERPARGSLSVAEYKEARDEMLGEIEQEYSKKQAQVKAIQSEIATLQTQKKVLTAAEVEAIQGEKSFFGGLKGVTYKEYESLKRTAMEVDHMRDARDKAIAGLKKARQRAADAEERAKRAEEEANAAKEEYAAKKRVIEQERPSIKQRKKIEELQQFIDRLLNIIREKLPAVYDALMREQKERKPKTTDWER